MLATYYIVHWLCPNTFVSIPGLYSVGDATPWVQVNFLEPKQLSGVLLQGQWHAGFHVQHSMDGVHFEDYIDSPADPPRVFITQPPTGRAPTYQIFNRNIIAQYLRIVPLDVSDNVEVK